MGCIQKEEHMQHYGSTEPQVYLKSSESSSLVAVWSTETRVDKIRVAKKVKLHYEGCWMLKSQMYLSEIGSTNSCWIFPIFSIKSFPVSFTPPSLNFCRI